MKDRIMFFVQRRGGGTLFNRLLGEIDDSEAMNYDWQKPVLLPTEERCRCHLLYTRVHEILLEGVTDRPHAFCTYAEASGSKPDIDIMNQTIPLWGLPNIDSWLPDNEWKVFFLVRDGRDHITSLLKGEYEVKIASGILPPHETWSFLDDLDRFQELCLDYKFKHSLYLEAVNNRRDTHLLYFEDMISDPQRFISGVLSSCGFTPKLGGYSINENTTSVWVDRSNGDETSSLDKPRYSCWRDEHYRICYETMSPELKKLGFSGRGIDRP